MLWHLKTAELIGRPLVANARANKAVRTIEAQRGFRFPDSVREWYSIEGAVEILREYSNDDSPVPLARLGEPFSRWYNGGPRDFVSEGRLVFLIENQGVCQWSVALSNALDPPVEVIVDPGPNDDWVSCASSFSEFVYTQVWDHPRWPYCGTAQLPALEPDHLRTIRERSREDLRSSGWPGRTSYRFTCGRGRILIWDGEGRSGADWQVFAPSEAAFEMALRCLWPIEAVRTVLYCSDDARRVLDKLKAGTT